MKLIELHDFWKMPEWSLELVQDMGVKSMISDKGVQESLFEVWEKIQSTHFAYLDYLKIRSAFWRKQGWVKDLTTEGIEPNPGPKSGSGFKPTKTKAKKKTMVASLPRPIRGKGDYKTDLGSLIRSGGAKLGELAGSAISKIFGFGDYTVTKNSLLGGAPVFNAKREERISRRVYIGEVKSAVNFTTQYYFPLNPAYGAFDPQLRLEAWNYEQYIIHGMVFYFRTLSATAVASTNTALGAIMMATNYDSNSAPFDSKLSMENHLFSTSSVPCEDSIHAVECDRKQSVLSILYNRRTDHEKITGSLVNPGNLPQVIEDYHTYDFGDFQLAAQGSQAVSSVGELWCSYDISLLKHKLLATPSVMEYLGLNILPPAFTGSCSHPPLPNNGLFGQNIGDFTSSISVDPRSTLIPIYSNPSDIILGKLPPGNYLVTLDLNWGTASSGGGYSWPQLVIFDQGTINSPVIGNNIFLSGSGSVRAAPQSNLDGVVTAQCQYSFTVTPNIPWAASSTPVGAILQVDYSLSAGPTVPTSASLQVTGFSNINGL